MLEANKSKVFEYFFNIYNRNLLKRKFHTFRVSGLENFAVKNNFPTIIFANHSSWWDGLAAFHIWKSVGLDNFVMMEEKQLKNLQLFRLLGAFSVIREKPKEAIKSLNYSVNLLKENSNRSLWIFPQGKILHNDIRPLCFFNGLTRIIEKLETTNILPIAFRYECGGEVKPEILVKIGKAETIETDQSFSAKKYTNNLTIKLTKLLDELKKDVIENNLSNYSNII